MACRCTQMTTISLRWHWLWEMAWRHCADLYRWLSCRCACRHWRHDARCSLLFCIILRKERAVHTCMQLFVLLNAWLSAMCCLQDNCNLLNRALGVQERRRKNILVHAGLLQCRYLSKLCTHECTLPSLYVCLQHHLRAVPELAECVGASETAAVLELTQADKQVSR